MKLTIGYLFPELLNLYGDAGNLRCLQKRLEWRGIHAEIKSFAAGEKIDFNTLDMLLIGGGSDREQKLACQFLKDIRDDFKTYVEKYGVVLAVCGGYQLLGNFYRTNCETMEGMGILDIYTEWNPNRLTQDIVIQNPLFAVPIIGFENHSGRTYIGNYHPFGKVLTGYGNTEDSGFEGIMYKNLIGTYLHGPLLPKNPHVCDYLLTQAFTRKYGQFSRLPPLSDELEYRANHEMLRRLTPGNFLRPPWHFNR